MFTFTVGSDGSAGTLALSGGLTIQRAQELKAALVEATGKAERIVLNLEQVSEVDLSAIQLLCAMHRHLQENGKKLTLSGKLPESFLAAVEIAGYKNCSGEGDTSGLWTGVSN